MGKINIAELLKDCPKGMELDCTIWDSEAKAFLKRVLNDDFAYPIEVTVKYNNTECTKSFTKYGAFNDLSYCKCVIFPKGKTTWEGFVPPCQFKDGDIVATNSELQVFILQRAQSNTKGYCYIGYDFEFNDFFHAGVWEFDRLATEEEKQKLFDAIKANGYRWNPETKTLEKLPKFKVGDVIVNIHRKHLHCDGASGKISQITDDKYIFTDGSYISISNQDDWELVPNKFDITTLKPFDKVFVRDNNTQEWVISFFSHCNGLETYKYSCINGCGYAQCVPYEENKHLLGTTNDCDDFYKTWEK